ncbi:MAG: nicotinate phosphoribosyltransferase [Syntrophothermus sp.]
MIIKSFLDTDLYKLTMMQAILHRYKDVWAKYKFINRKSSIYKTGNIKEELIDEIKNLSEISLSNEEADYLSSLKYFQNDFIEYLKAFHLNPSHIKIEDDTKNPEQLDITIEGPWIETILYEVIILAIINEIAFSKRKNENSVKVGNEKIKKKVIRIKGLKEPDFKVIEFGTRRRASFEWHGHLLKIFKDELRENFTQTSNVYYAMKYGLIPSGTMAHEWIQAHQVLTDNLIEHQKKAFQLWLEEYKGKLSIALTDTINMKSFLKDFDKELAEQYIGCRQDSGSPFEWGEELIRHYENLTIDAKNKLAIFSDSLTIDKAISIYKYFKGRIKLGFGIGTHLTNDMGLTPLNVVIKMVECNKKPVAKLTDSKGKEIISNKEYYQKLKNTFGIK